MRCMKADALDLPNSRQKSRRAKKSAAPQTALQLQFSDDASINSMDSTESAESILLRPRPNILPVGSSMGSGLPRDTPAPLSFPAALLPRSEAAAVSPWAGTATDSGMAEAAVAVDILLAFVNFLDIGQLQP
jgi:hypothetical protein